jgi:uncharacterized protein YecE (DUF72 family)
MGITANLGERQRTGVTAVSVGVYTDHVKYPNIADTTGMFIYARLQRGKDTVPTAYPPKEIKAWAGRLRQLAGGEEPADPAHRRAASAQAGAARSVCLCHS